MVTFSFQIAMHPSLEPKLDELINASRGEIRDAIIRDGGNNVATIIINDSPDTVILTVNCGYPKGVHRTYADLHLIADDALMLVRSELYDS